MNLLITDAFHGEALANLAARLKCQIRKSQDLRPTAEELKDVDGLLIRSRTKIEENLLKQAPKLKWVVTATSGFEHIDWQACQKRGITSAFTPEANAASAAELTISLMLNLLRQTHAAAQAVHKNQWRSDDLRAHSLQGLQLGIVGLGRIGQRVARAAQALGMQVQATDPYLEDHDFEKLGIKRIAFTELLVSSDVITLHTPLTQETYHLLNHQSLKIINPEAYLINAARGPLIDENELILCLENNKLKGAALDVFEREPLIKESRLRQLKNVILTPHIGAFTHQAINAASQQAVEKTVEFFTTGKTSHTLPLNVPWFSKVTPQA